VKSARISGPLIGPFFFGLHSMGHQTLYNHRQGMVGQASRVPERDRQDVCPTGNRVSLLWQRFGTALFSQFRGVAYGKSKFTGSEDSSKQFARSRLRKVFHEHYFREWDEIMKIGFDEGFDFII